MFVNYFMTVNADLASAGSRERFYAAGSIFLILNSSLQLFSKVFSLSISPSVVSSILSLVLFVAVIPLLYALETLPREKIRRRRLGEHLKKVKKLIEEEETQNPK